MDTRHLFGSMMAAQAFLSCEVCRRLGLGFECPHWLLLSRKCVWLLSNSSLTPPMTLIFVGSFRELGHLNSVSRVLVCLPTISPPCCAALSHSAVTLRTVARQAPMSLGFSRQDRWSGLGFSSPMDRICPPKICMLTP